MFSMKSQDLIVIVAVIFAVGFSLYRRYMKNKQQNTGGFTKPSGPPSPSKTRDDDYEPYSGK